jgi:hypothetical protein
MQVKSKYRGTVNYFLVMAELVRAAQYRGVTTYQDIAVIMGLPITGSHMAKETGHILGEVSEDEAKANRPMLSALAVSVKLKPSPPFFDLARSLGRLAREQDEEAFLEEEQCKLYDVWRRHLPKKRGG